MTLVERFDRTLLSTLSLVLLLSGVALIGWSLLLVAAQCAGWLKFGAWQSVPFYALWLSPIEQLNQTVPMALWGATWSPIDIVPSMWVGSSLQELSRGVGGSMAGVVIIAEWILSSPLSLVSVVSGVGCIGASAVANESHLPG